MLLPRRDRTSVCPAARLEDTNSHSHHNGFNHTDRVARPFADAIPEHDADSYRDADDDVHPDRHADPIRPSDCDVYCLADVHAGTDPDLYAYPHTFANGYSHADSHCHADGYRDSYYHTIPHAMTDTVPFLKSLISTSGVSAYEAPVARLIEEKWKPLVDETSTSRLGSLHALKRGKGIDKRPSIMIATHMDAIGLIVSRIEDGFLYVDDIGGVDPRILPGTPVIVHGKQDLPGVVVLPPLKSLPEAERKGAVGLRHLLVDVGLPPSRVARLVRVGDTISFDTPPIELAGDALSGHALDNRASVAALTVCLEDLQGKSHDWDVWAVATVQEEETFGGAVTSAFHLEPDLAIAVDVTFAKGPGANDWQAFSLGKGPTLGWGANLHPFLFERLKELAERLEIPVSTDLTPAHSSTDAQAIQVAREGIPTMLLGIPLRYMHTPVEVVAIKDILRTGRLLAEFICGLGPDFVSQIVGEEQTNAK